MALSNKERQQKHRNEKRNENPKRNENVTKTIAITGGVKPVLVNSEKAAKLMMICKELDKEMAGLGSKKENLLDLVRYGVSGPTMREVRDILC